MEKRVLCCAMRIAKLMVESGAEIYRVEESLERVLRAYGAREVNVFAITSNIMVSVECEGYEIMSCSSRIRSIGNHVERMDRLNALVRRMAAQAPPIEQVEEEVERILSMPEYHPAALLAAHGMVTCSFGVLFGARGAAEILATMLIGVMVGICTMQLERLQANRLLCRFFCSFFASVLTFLAWRLGLVQSVDEIIIGNLMTLLPGCGFTNALRDLFAGDSVSGVLRLIEAILVAFTIAAGYVLAGILAGGVW